MLNSHTLLDLGGDEEAFHNDLEKGLQECCGVHLPVTRWEMSLLLLSSLQMNDPFL